MDRIWCQSLEVEYETLNQEAFCVLHFATTFNDERLRNKLIAMDNLTKENTTKIIAKYVSTKVSSGSIDKETTNLIASYSLNKKRIGGGRNSGKWKPCLRCGKTSHHSNDCSVLARGLCCDACGKKGHLASVCHSTMTKELQKSYKPKQVPMRSFAAAADNDEDKEEKNGHPMQMPMRSFAAATDNDDNELHPEVTPCLKVKCSYNQGSFTFQAFPDTGGCLTMIASDLVAGKKIDVDRNYNIPKLVAVNGDYVHTDGVVSADIQNLHNGISSCTLIIVSPGIKKGIWSLDFRS